MLGFALKRLWPLRRARASRRFLWAFGGLTVLLNAVQILYTYTELPLPARPGILLQNWSLFCDYAHAALGVTIFLALYPIFSGLRFPGWALALLRWSDRYSYDVYLVHQFFILSPFTLMALTPTPWLNIPIILGAIFCAAWLVNHAAELLRRGLAACAGRGNRRMGENAAPENPKE